MLFEEKPILSE